MGHVCPDVRSALGSISVNELLIGGMGDEGGGCAFVGFICLLFICCCFYLF